LAKLVSSTTGGGTTRSDIKYCVILKLADELLKLVFIDKIYAGIDNMLKGLSNVNKTD
jgi:hypothetical protein